MAFKLILALGLTALLLACATTSPDAGFGEVRNRVAERLNQRVHWRSGSAEDHEVDRTVTALLATELAAEQAVQIALLNNRRLQATYEELGVAQATLVQAGLIANPVFHAGVFFPAGKGSPDLDFSIAQDFLSVFFLSLRRSVAQAEFEAAKLKVTAAVISLAGDVQRTFYRLQAAQQMVEMFQQALKAAGASYEAARQLYDAGNITQLDLARERALFEEMRIALATAETELLRERERLTRLMGLWGRETEWTIARRLLEIPEDAPDLKDVEKRAIATSLDLAAARHRMESAARRAGIADAGALVQALELGAGAEREEDKWERGPTLRYALPLFDQGQAKRARARSELAQASHAYRALAIEIRSAARVSAQELEAAHSRALYAKNVLLPTLNQVVEQALLQYNAMQLGVFQLLDAQRAQISAGRQYVEALRSYWLARTELQLLLAGHMADLQPAAGAKAGTPVTGGMARGDQ
jgi:outer membrane protein, heavy metal efflux system